MCQNIISAANNWTNRIVAIKITTDRSQTSLAGDVSSVDSHTITTGSVKMATSCLSAALYVLNNCPIHSRYVRRGIKKRQFFEIGQFVNQVINVVHSLCTCNWTHACPIIINIQLLNVYMLQFNYMKTFQDTHS